MASFKHANGLRVMRVINRPVSEFFSEEFSFNAVLGSTNIRNTLSCETVPENVALLEKRGVWNGGQQLQLLLHCQHLELVLTHLCEKITLELLFQ